MGVNSIRNMVLVICLLSYSSIGYAKFYDMYRADYTKGAFCSALAGACASDNNPENSFFQNPASLESAGTELVYDGDFNPSDNLEPGMKTSSVLDQSTYMGGIAIAGPMWGYGLSMSGRSSSVNASATLVDDQDRSQSLNTKNSSTTIFFNFPFAKRVSPKFSVGIALLGMYYLESFEIENSPKSKTNSLDKFPQLGLSLGYLYSFSNYFRIGSWFRSPITYYVKQEIDVQQFSNQVRITEDLGLNYPLIFSNGISYMLWGDQRTFLLDLDLVGKTTNGFERTLDVFSTAVNETSAAARFKGRKIALEPHLAWRSPWWTGAKGTYTLGTYYENGRWDKIFGRIHGVTSVAYELGIFEAIVAVDVAKEYFNLLFSFR